MGFTAGDARLVFLVVLFVVLAGFKMFSSILEFFLNWNGLGKIEKISVLGNTYFIKVFPNATKKNNII